MTTPDAKALRKALKEAGYRPAQISVRTAWASTEYGLRVTVRSSHIRLAEVKRIAAAFRIPHKRYVFVQYSPEAQQEIIRRHKEAIETLQPGEYMTHHKMVIRRLTEQSWRTEFEDGPTINGPAIDTAYRMAVN